MAGCAQHAPERGLSASGQRPRRASGLRASARPPRRTPRRFVSPARWPRRCLERHDSADRSRRKRSGGSVLPRRHPPAEPRMSVKTTTRLHHFRPAPRAGNRWRRAVSARTSQWGKPPGPRPRRSGTSCPRPALEPLRANRGEIDEAGAPRAPGESPTSTRTTDSRPLQADPRRLPYMRYATSRPTAPVRAIRKPPGRPFPYRPKNRPR